MSWSYCAISGEALNEPVVSKKSGHVFEKRIIDKYVSSTGQCPITGQALSQDDLISVNLANQTKPRSATMNSVPGILKSFQSEWDGLMLETFTLKQHLETVRQELSHALYQHDAACRVIARLIKERDDARKEVVVLQERLREGKMDIEEEQSVKAQATQLVLPQEVVKSVNETALELSQIRKEKKKDTEHNSKFASQQQIASFSAKETVGLHATANSGISALAFSREAKLAVSGGDDGNVVAYDLRQNAVVGTTSVGKPVIAVSILVNSLNEQSNSSSSNNVRFVVATKNSAVVYEYLIAEKTFNTVYSYVTAAQLTSVAAHPNGTLFVLGARDGTFTYHDTLSKSLVLNVTELAEKVQISGTQVHPDGNLLGVGCSDGSVKLWNIASNEMLTSLEDDLSSPIDLISFSENGFSLAVGSRVAKVVKIFDLRKAKCVKTISTLSPTSLEFDLSGNVLAIGTQQGQIVLIETKKWNDLATLSSHSSEVTSVKFDHFSQKMVTASADKNLIVYEF